MSVSPRTTPRGGCALNSSQPRRSLLKVSASQTVRRQTPPPQAPPSAPSPAGPATAPLAGSAPGKPRLLPTLPQLGGRPWAAPSPQKQQQKPQHDVSAAAAAAAVAATVAAPTAIPEAAPPREQAPAAPGAAAAAAAEGAAYSVGAWWDALPARYRVLTGAFLSFIIANLDKVNMSVAIVPMAADFGWSPSVSGVVQSAFFWGYILSQLPGGYLTSRHGGRATLSAGVAGWSLATAAVPLLAGTVPGLCFARAAVGLGEAVAPSAATDMVSRIVPPEERSRAVSFVFSGLHVGSIAGLLAAPWLISSFGWPSIFLSFGAVGIFWSAWFEGLMATLARADPETAAALTVDRLATPAAAGGEAASSSSSSQQQQHEQGHGGHAAGPLSGHIPWRAFLRSRGVQALMYTHFCNSWLHYCFLAWLPTFFVDTLHVDLMHAAYTALLPPIAGIAASAAAGLASDGAIAAGAPVPLVRKAAQSVAFLVPTACLLAAAAAGPEGLSPAASIGLVTVALGMSSFSLAGLYCTHQDLSTKYSSALLGLTNTAGAVPGIIGVAATGMLYDSTHSWAAALFVPTAFFLTTGAAVYVLAGSNAPVDFDAAGADAPFGVELRFKRAASRARAALEAAAARLPRGLWRRSSGGGGGDASKAE